MDVYIESFIKTLEKKKEKNEIEYNIIISDSDIFFKTESLSNIIFPEKIFSFLSEINLLNIVSPRNFEILSITKFELIDDRYLWFSTINKSIHICFDTKCLNSAKEWDIINLENKFVITKTLSSYLTNKIWAWIDRGRKIWDEELYID